MSTLSTADAGPATRAVGGRGALTASVLLALFLAAADSTVVGALLPSISGALGDTELYPWLVSGFLLTSVLSAALAGPVADRIGARRTMCGALALFGLASTAVAMAPNMLALVGARAVQGAGAGMVTALAYVLVGQAFDAAGRAKMQGLLSAVWGLAAVLGPALGAAAQATVGWRWVFALNLPLAAVAAVLISRQAPGRPAGATAGQPLRIAPLAAFAVLLGGVLLLLVSPTLNLGTAGISVIALVTAAALGLHLTQVRRRPGASLLPTPFVTQPQPRAAALVSIGASVVLYAAVTLLPLALARSNGGSEAASGLVVMVGALGWVAGSALCGKLLAKLGARGAAVVGGALLAAGPLLLAFGRTPGMLASVPGLLLIGLGTGFTTASALVQVQNAAPQEQLGSWTGAVTLCRNLGAAVGVNLLASVQVTAAAHLNGPEAEAQSYRLAFAILAALGLLTLLAASRLKARQA